MYAGLEFGAECYCGHRVQSNKSLESECQMNCTGNPSLVCGGASRLSVFRLKLSQESARRREFHVTQWPKLNLHHQHQYKGAVTWQLFLHYNPPKHKQCGFHIKNPFYPATLKNVTTYNICFLFCSYCGLIVAAVIWLLHSKTW